MPPEKSSLKKHKGSHHRRQARVIIHMRMRYLKRQSKLDKSAIKLSVCLSTYLSGSYCHSHRTQARRYLYIKDKL